MLELILPAGVESEERFGAASGGVLFPEEEQIIAHAVPARRREYAAVRSCARACLGRLGYPGAPILPGAGGAPAWPAGVLGSMTHCPGYTAAAVGPHPRICAIGIDAEPDTPLPEDVLDLVATPAEQDRLAAPKPVPDGPNWDRLLFSAKEAVYKAWFPRVGEWLDHQEAEIRPAIPRRPDRQRPPHPPPPRPLDPEAKNPGDRRNRCLNMNQFPEPIV
jgi:enterobactin synthetase component D / holo-[acyl-carrier protein] synthase